MGRESRFMRSPGVVASGLSDGDKARVVKAIEVLESAGDLLTDAVNPWECGDDGSTLRLHERVLNAVLDINMAWGTLQRLLPPR